MHQLPIWISVNQLQIYHLPIWLLVKSIINQWLSHQIIDYQLVCQTEYQIITYWFEYWLIDYQFSCQLNYWLIDF